MAALPNAWTIISGSVKARFEPFNSMSTAVRRQIKKMEDGRWKNNSRVGVTASLSRMLHKRCQEALMGQNSLLEYFLVEVYSIRSLPCVADSSQFGDVNGTRLKHACGQNSPEQRISVMFLALKCSRPRGQCT